eukprot:TRINITY_DN25374_c0_g1_i1.p1 TRINITY_DN25374_c0_g1~~TRINITY_DN25374_c0_g1_i1.p1  ORF type:complete len:518 (+),score=159.33 TRINITY_DN25374_c0_g1_i1:75-1628(+)
MAAAVELFCTTPFGLEFILREDAERAAGAAFAGFRDCSAPGVVRFALRAPDAAALRAALKRVHALRSVEHMCSFVYESPPQAYPMESPSELDAIEKEAGTKKGDFMAAAGVWAVARGGEAPEPAGFEALAKDVLFRCTALRYGKGMRLGKPKYKSPDVERRVGAAVHGLFGWRASMLLYTLRVMVVLVDSRAVVGIALDPSDTLTLRPGFSFQTTSREARDKQSRADVSQASEERLSKLAVTESIAVATRNRILAGEPVSIIKEIDKDVVGSLKEARHKHDVRAAKSENSMSLPIAHALLHLSAIEAGDVVVDPMAGSGTTLLEASLLHPMPSAVIGGDITLSECTVATLNADSFQFMASKHDLCAAPSLMAAGADGSRRKRRRVDGDAPAAAEGHHRFHRPLGMGVLNWDATRLPLRTGGADVVVTDFPFGNRCVRSVKLYPKVVGEFARLLRPGGRCTFLGVQHKALQAILDSTEFDGIWRTRRAPFKVNMGEMYPTIFCLERTDAPWSGGGAEE